jgi:hypothetical protein
MPLFKKDAPPQPVAAPETREQKIERQLATGREALEANKVEWAKANLALSLDDTAETRGEYVTAKKSLDAAGERVASLEAAKIELAKLVEIERRQLDARLYKAQIRTCLKHEDKVVENGRALVDALARAVEAYGAMRENLMLAQRCPGYPAWHWDKCFTFDSLVSAELYRLSAPLVGTAVNPRAMAFPGSVPPSMQSFVGPSEVRPMLDIVIHRREALEAHLKGLPLPTYEQVADAPAGDPDSDILEPAREG